jgi:DNA polymerase III subunit delta'
MQFDSAARDRFGAPCPRYARERRPERMSEALDQATERQLRARAAIAAALAAGPSHAYLLRGPRGAGKRAAARAFAAEILAGGSEGPEDARRRALLDPSPHPDLVWLAPTGPRHMVEEVRERVIRGAAYRPFEGERRVFVIEAAEALGDESQNALLKTLEEPPAFVHLILISSEPEALQETIVSRCQAIEFSPLPPEAIEESLNGAAEPDELATVARLSGGDLELAGYLISDDGRALREAALVLARATGRDSPDTRREGASADTGPTAPWTALLNIAEQAGEHAEEETRRALEAQAEAGLKRSRRELGDEARRAGRRRRTEILDLGLGLVGSWYRDLAAVSAGADEVVFNRDRPAELRSGALGLDPAPARRAAELVQDTRRRLDLNVSEELALEALFFRIDSLLG